MNRLSLKSAVLLLPAFFSAAAWAQPQQSASAADADCKAPAELARPASPLSAHVFEFPVATKSAEAQKLVETAISLRAPTAEWYLATREESAPPPPQPTDFTRCSIHAQMSHG